MKMRLLVNENGELVQRDGTVVGRITALTVELNGDHRGKAASKNEKASKPLPHENGDQGALLPDPVVETWELYLRLLKKDPARNKLRPTVRRWIKEAHQHCGIDRTREAIRGLSMSTFHLEGGYTAIEYAIRPKENESIDGRIEKMANYTKTADGSPMHGRDVLARFSEEAQESIYAYLNRIQQSLRHPDSEALQMQANDSYAALTRMGVPRPTFDGASWSGWAVEGETVE